MGKPDESKLTGTQIHLLRTARMHWTMREFSAFLGASVSCVARWEACESKPIPIDPYYRDLVQVLTEVLDQNDAAREVIEREARGHGRLRAHFVLLGLYYDDTPWREGNAARRDASKARLRKREAA
jgi:hypothetical protein